MSAFFAWLDSDAAAIPAAAFWVALLLGAWLIGWRRKRQLLRDRAAFERMMRWCARREREEARERTVLDRRAQELAHWCPKAQRAPAAPDDLEWAARTLWASVGATRMVEGR